MNRTLYVLTTDPDRTWEMAHYAPREVRVESLFPRDGLPAALVAWLVVDLDYLHLDRAGRDRLVEQAGQWAARFPVAVLSFNLEDAQEKSLQPKGVIVARALDAAVIHRLIGLTPGAAAAVLAAA
jgi:hypothetical protein